LVSVAGGAAGFAAGLAFFAPSPELLWRVGDFAAFFLLFPIVRPPAPGLTAPGDLFNPECAASCGIPA